MKCNLSSEGTHTHTLDDCLLGPDTFNLWNALSHLSLQECEAEDVC